MLLLHPSISTNLCSNNLFDKHSLLMRCAQPRSWARTWKVFLLPKCFEIFKWINAKDQTFMHCFARHGLWNELWCLGKHAGGCFYNNSNIDKNRVTPPDNDNDDYHYCHAFVTVFKQQHKLLSCVEKIYTFWQSEALKSYADEIFNCIVFLDRCTFCHIDT